MATATSTGVEAQVIDTGLLSLCMIARRLGLKTRLVATRWERLARTPLPAIAENANGSFVAVTRMVDDKVVVHLPGEWRAKIVEQAEFEAEWSGRLILLRRRASIAGLPEVFDLRWFISEIRRYRRIIGEVLIASFFLQLLGLISPLAFQVVVDKVLVHRSLSTLDVLMIGLAIVAIFEVLLGGLRTFVFSQTTNKIDVELGGRLFDHLMGLPMAYFASRRVGDSVARARIGKYPQLHHRVGADLDDRSVLHLRFLRSHVSIQRDADLHRAGLVAVLCPDQHLRDADLPPPAQRAVSARRRQPGIPGRSGHRRRNRHGDGGRAADAAALGRAARRLDRKS